MCELEVRKKPIYLPADKHNNLLKMTAYKALLILHVSWGMNKIDAILHKMILNTFVEWNVLSILITI